MKKLLLLFAALCSTIMMQAEIVHHNQCAPGRQRGFTQECWEDTGTGTIYADAACTEELNAATVVKYSKLATNNLSQNDRKYQAAEGEYGGATFYYPCKKSFFSYQGWHDMCSFEVHSVSSKNARLKLYVSGGSEEIIRDQDLEVTSSFGSWCFDLHPGLVSIPLPTMKFGDIVSLRLHTWHDHFGNLGTDIIVSLEYEADSQIIITADSKKKFSGTKDQMLTWSQAGDLLYGETLNISLEREQGEDIGSYSIHASETGTGIPDVDVTFVDGTFSIVEGIHHSKSKPTINHLGYTQDCWEDKSTGKLYSDSYLEQELNPIITKLYPKLLVNPTTETNGFTTSESDTFEGNNFNWVAKAEYNEHYYEEYSDVVFDVNDIEITDARLIWCNNSNRLEGRNCFHIYVYINGALFYREISVYDGLFELLLPELKHGDQVKFTVEKTDKYSNTSYPIFFGVSFEYLGPCGGDPDAWGIVADNKRKFSGVDDPELTWTRRYVNTPSEEPEGIIITRESGETPGNYNIHVTQEYGANSGQTVLFEDGTLEIVAGTHHEKGEPYNDGLIFSQDCWEDNEGKYYLDGYLEHEVGRVAVIGYPKLAVNPIVDSGKFIIKESAVYDDTPFDWVAETTFEKKYTTETRSVEFKVYDEDVTNARIALYISTMSSNYDGRSDFTVYKNDVEIFSDVMPRNGSRPAGLMFIPLTNLNRGDIIRFEFHWEGWDATPTVAVCMQYCSPTATVAGTIDIAVGDKHNSYNIRKDKNLKLTWFTNAENNTLLQAEAPGTIGNHFGREAIVVDLGSNVGKVAVATKNVGANEVKHQGNDDLGTGFTFEDANDYTKNTLTDEWHVPSYEELKLLVENLVYDRSDVGLKWRFEDKNTELWIPGYRDSQSNFGGAYAGAKVNATDYAIMYFDITSPEGQGWHKVVENDVTIEEPWDDLRIRPFHCLYKNYRCMNIETDNEVLNFFGVDSDTKISFIPKVAGHETSVKLVFNDNAPIETEHFINGTNISFSDDGMSLYMTVNGKQVTYAVDDLKEITFFDGTPSVQLTANQDPDHAGNYYTTFYSGLEAYTLPKGVKAYTATMGEDNGDTIVRLTAIEGDVLPQGEAVLLYTDDNDGNITLTIADGSGVSKSDANEFQGVDVATSQNNGSNYMLSYGQNGLGFYKMNPGMKLSANKAFLSASEPSMAKGLRMVFDNTYGGVNGIDVVNADNNADNNIYSISGIRLNKLQKGINIVGGKKIIVK